MPTAHLPLSCPLRSPGIMPFAQQNATLSNAGCLSQPCGSGRASASSRPGKVGASASGTRSKSRANYPIIDWQARALCSDAVRWSSEHSARACQLATGDGLNRLSRRDPLTQVGRCDLTGAVDATECRRLRRKVEQHRDNRRSRHVDRTLWFHPRRRRSVENATHFPYRSTMRWRARSKTAPVNTPRWAASSGTRSLPFERASNAPALSFPAAR
jgi:hypothetical protein